MDNASGRFGGCLPAAASLERMGRRAQIILRKGPTSIRDFNWINSQSKAVSRRMVYKKRLMDTAFKRIYTQEPSVNLKSISKK